MNGIVSRLDPQSHHRIETLQNDILQRCELVRSDLPAPHLTWQVVEKYDLVQLDCVLKKFITHASPFTVRLAGLGIFTGPAPILYVAVTKDEPLLRFHEQLWQWVYPIAQEPAPYYLPDAWVPHITLAMSVLAREDLLCALDQLAYQPFDWEIRIDHLVCIAQTEAGTFEACHEYYFENG